MRFEENMDGRGHIPEYERSPKKTPQISRIPPEDNVPKGCSLQSMEPLREWFLASPAECEATLCQLEQAPPDIRQFNANIREECWTHFSLEGVKFPASTVDVIQSGEALAIFEGDLNYPLPTNFTGRSLVYSSPVGGVKRSLEIYRRVDETTRNYPWSILTTEELWHVHAEGALMVALTNLNLPTEAWKSARLQRAAPNLSIGTYAGISYAKSSLKC